MTANFLNSKNIDELSQKADEILLEIDQEKLKTFLDSLLGVVYTFECLVDEARFYYMLGNCTQVLYSYNRLDWFSDELSKSVMFFRKALYLIRKVTFQTDEEMYLQSCIETNLANSLSSQGRAFCCIPLWDSAAKYKQNLVPILSKARNELFIANNLYDPGHRDYHYFTAYQLIQFGLEHIDQLYPEQRVAYSEGSDLMNFKASFEDTYKTEDFKYFDADKMKFKSKKQRDYLKWCADNRLFINDLNDVSVSEIVYQDIMTLPTISQLINSTLLMHEQLMYHGNFDELKNDYCYARYLIFSAKDVANDQSHFFNQTYPHVNDMALTINNLKASQYKSAFKILYSLFDKIAYFIHRFFDLNDTDLDHRISFDSIFRKIGDKKWKPNSKLKDSRNYFLHALFYILKDIRDVNDSPKVSRFLDPDAKAFVDIRNAIEHRSLKIIEDSGYLITQSGQPYRQLELEKLNQKISEMKVQHEKLSREIGLERKVHNSALKAELEIKIKLLDIELDRAQLKVCEQKKLSSHSVLIDVSEFESRLMTLINLARNSIMYLSLAIHVEERNKPDDEALAMSREVPLKQ